MTKASDLVSVVDVVENTWSLSIAEASEFARTADRMAFEQLNEAVNDFYAVYEAPRPDGDEYRVSFGGWIANNLTPEHLAYLRSSLLYADSTVIYDPIAAWFYPRRDELQALPSIKYANGLEIQSSEPAMLQGDGHHAPELDEERERQHIVHGLHVLAELAPLIRSSLVIPLNHLELMRRVQEGVISAVRHDLRDAGFTGLIENPIDLPPPRSDQIRGMEVSAGVAVRPEDRLREISQNSAYYLNKTIALAAESGSRYVPPAATDWRLYEYRLDKLGAELRGSAKLDLTVIGSLQTSELPYLADVSTDQILKVRQNEAPLEDFRRLLRRAVRQLETSPQEGDAFASEAKAVLADSLEPVAQDVRETVSRSAVLKKASREGGLNLVLGGATLGGLALAGAPIGGAAIAAGLSAIGRWVYGTTFGRDKPRGANAVVAQLLSGAPDRTGHQASGKVR